MTAQLTNFFSKLPKKTKSSHTTYRISSGNKVPSVTTVIGNNLGWNKQALISWTRRETAKGHDTTKVLSAAASVGNAAHYLIECKIKKKVPDISQHSKETLKKAKNGYYSFLEWESKFKPNYKYSELKLVSEEHKFGGTVDLVLEIDNELYIYDIKTTNFIHSEMFIQVAAYKQLFEENYDTSIKACNIVQISKEEATYNVCPISNNQITDAWTVFQSLLTINNLKENIEQKA